MIAKEIVFGVKVVEKAHKRAGKRKGERSEKPSEHWAGISRRPSPRHCEARLGRRALLGHELAEAVADLAASAEKALLIEHLMGNFPIRGGLREMGFKRLANRRGPRRTRDQDCESQAQGHIFEVFCLELIQSPKNQTLAEFKPIALEK